MMQKIVFFLGLIAAAGGFASPPVALALGLIFGLSFPYPFGKASQLIGRGISVATLKQVGHGPLLQGVVLWLLVSITSLGLIRAGWIGL